jgi:hypothetical protein
MRQDGLISENEWAEKMILTMADALVEVGWLEKVDGQLRVVNAG